MTTEQNKTTTPTTGTMTEEECKESTKVKEDATIQQVVVSRDELTELVRAIKFAKPDASQRDVFKEITEVIACSSSFNSSSSPDKSSSSSSSENDNSRIGEYAFLKDAVQLNDVKKVWKKATAPTTTSSASSPSSKNNNGTTPGSNLDSNLAEKLKVNSSGGVPELFTVGMNTNANANANELSAVQILANDYVSSFLEEQAVKSAKEASIIANDYVHVFLDVPADRSGTRPHQALINFQNNNKNKKKAAAAAGGGGKGKGKGKGKKGGSKKNNTVNVSTDHVNSADAEAAAAGGGGDGINSDLPFDDAIIVKIQKAAPMHPNDTTKYPMLVYDQTKTYKTFIHPDPVVSTADLDRNVEDGVDDAAEEEQQLPPDNLAGGGYDKISSLIQTSGVGGAVGATGGTKCYFFGRISSGSSNASPNSGRNKQKGPDILSIYIKSLAPYQEEW